MNRLTRREFLRLCGTSSLGLVLAACGVAPTPIGIPTTANPPVPITGSTPLPTTANPPLPTNTLLPSSPPTLTRTPAPTRTITPAATATPATVPAPPRGLGSNSNYFLTSDCDPVTGLSVTVEVTQDIVCETGFSIQLNCYSPSDANTVYQQYVMSFDTSDGSPLRISGAIDNWPSESFSRSLGLVPHTSLILTSGGGPMLTLPTATLPAGYKFTISLTNDKDQNVNGVTFLIVDNKAKSTKADIQLQSLSVFHSNPPKPVPSSALAPVYVFELNLVGPGNGKTTYFSAGAGTITFTASSPLSILSKKPTCSADQNVVTEEASNCTYGPLSPGPTHTITQTFNTPAPSPYTPGAALAVSPQFGTTQTDLFAITGAGQLGEFYVQADGHWHAAPPKGPVGLARPGAAMAVSQHYGAANQTDVFLIDQNGQLNLFWAIGAGNWNGPQTIGAKRTAHSGANLAASKHFGTDNQTDLFVVDENGQLNMFSAVGSTDWKGPSPIGANGFGHTGGHLAASPRFGVENQTDVYLVDANGQLNVFSADAAGHWRGPQSIGAAGAAPAGAALAVSPRFGVSNQTDVFLVDSRGQLNVFSVDGAGHWTGPQAIGPARLAQPGAPVSVSQDPAKSNQTDVFLIDRNGQLNMFWVEGTGDWNGPQAIGQAGLAPSEGVVVASLPPGGKHQADVFFINQTGVNSPGWPTVFESGDSGTWNGPKALVNEI